MREIWKDINGFEGLYKISNNGRVKGLARKVWNKANGSYSQLPECIKIPDSTNKPYAQIALSKNGKYKKFLIHRLVAIHFVPNPNNLPEVNHKDLNKKNCNANNLEWSTRLSNAQHAKANGSYDRMPKGTQRVNSILTDEAVRHIRQKQIRNIDYCKKYKVSPSTVTMIQKDLTRWKHVR
jgi:hypothetical protein